MILEPIIEIPYPSTATIGGPEFEDLGYNALLWLILDNEGDSRRIEFVFARPKASRHKAEAYRAYVQGAYDTLCEVIDSSWVRQLQAECKSEIRKQDVLRHFIIYLDSYGSIEVIAESVEMSEVASGSPLDFAG